MGYWLKALTVGKVSFGLRFGVPWTMTMIVAQKRFVTYPKRKKRRMICFLYASPDG